MVLVLLNDGDLDASCSNHRNWDLGSLLDLQSLLAGGGAERKTSLYFLPRVFFIGNTGDRISL